jgi:hypothetical protein
MELIVLQGDATQRMSSCAAKLDEWRRSGAVDGVILSAQSVLHELPKRSPGYNPNALLGDVLRPFTTRLVYCREPACPRPGTGWPGLVQWRLPGLAGKHLFGLSRMISDVLGFNEAVTNLADGYVQMSSGLAVETMFKILYCDDIDSYRHEMEERVTSFDAEIFQRILRNFIQPAENVECEYIVTDSFRQRYKEHGVQARTDTGDVLAIPRAFARITGFQSAVRK